MKTKRKSKRKSSSGNTHPYMKGFRFWSQKPFWQDMKNLSQEGKAYYEKWLDDLKKNEIVLSRITVN